MEKGCATAGISYNEDRRFDNLSSVPPKQDVVDEKTEPDREFEQGKKKVEGDEDRNAPGCPPATGQPEVRESEEAAEIENHLDGYLYCRKPADEESN
jgi:hypothetical protein